MRHKQFFILILMTCCYNSYAQEDTGIAVSAAELEWRLTEMRAACFDHFTKQYGIYDQPDFWTHSFKGETPAQWIRKKTLALIITDKKRLKIMQRYGLLKDFSFEWFKNACQIENARRKDLAERGAVIYGMESFDEHTFYAYIMGNALLEVRRRILAVHPPSAEMVRTEYERVKHTAFKVPPTMQVQLLKNGVVQYITFAPSNRRADELLWDDVYTRSRAFTKAGEWSPTFRDAKGDICVLKCLSITDNGFLPLEEVTEHLKMLIAGREFERMVNGLDVLN